MGKESKIAILEYLCSEILELSGNVAITRSRSNKSRKFIINIDDFFKTILGDEELRELFQETWNIFVFNSNKRVTKILLKNLLNNKEIFDKFRRINAIDCVMIKNYSDEEIKKVFNYISTKKLISLTENEIKLYEQLKN